MYKRQIGDIPVNVADDVAKKLADFQDTFSIHFNTEDYLKAELASEYANQKMYDPKKENVAKYRSGAYGVRIKASDDEIVRYVFNVCLKVLAKEFSSY